MPFTSTRRRLVAALAAMGASSLLPSLARAQSSSEEAAPLVVVPCEVREVSGTATEPANNYVATAKEANFAFIAHIKAQGDHIILFADAAESGMQIEGPALIKGRVSRAPGDKTVTAEQISFEAPLTAFEQGGQYYGIVQMSQEQGVPVGLVFYLGDKEAGEWELKKGVADPTSQEVVFNDDQAKSLFDGLRGTDPFRASLVAGGTVYSEISIEPGAFAEFIDTTLIGAMDKAAATDLATPCTTTAGGDLDCFLTGACCAVVGLADDCWELQSLRAFRDSWMGTSVEGRDDVARYYSEAPAVAAKLLGSRAGRLQLLALYWTVIVPAAVLIRLGANRLAYRLYRRMMLGLLPG